MFTQIGIFTFVNIIALALMGFPAYSQTTQDATQNAHIEGSENEINQTINQYYFNNPGKGAINRKQETGETNKPKKSSGNSQQNRSNKTWGQAQGEQNRNNSNSNH